jgi:PAS domain S-box-containing protein
VVYCAGLENRRAARLRGFESHLLRQTLFPMPSSRFAPLRFTIQRKVLIGFGTLIFIFAVIALISWRSTVIFIRSAERVAHAHEVLETVEQAKRHLMEMESARRGFLLSGQERWLIGFSEAEAQLRVNFDGLKASTSDEPEQTMRLDRLYELLQRSVALPATEIATRRDSGADAALLVFNRHVSEDLTEAIKKLLNEFEVEQRKTLVERGEATNSVAQATLLAIAAGAALTFGALVVGCSLILRDIAARRRAEESLAAEHNLLSSIMDTMPNHVFLKDAKGRFILNNAAHRRYLGLAEQESVEGRTVADFFPNSVSESVGADDRYVIETGEAILNREQLIQWMDREDWLETSKVPLRDTDGRIIGLVGVSSDISQRKEAEQQLRRFAAQLERSNAELANFASVASHDLQEPLRKIQAFGDRLKAKCSEALGDQGRDYLARMQNAAERMQVLIQDLLKLSRITSRAQPFQSCDLNQIISEVLTDLEVAIENQKARVEVGELPVIDADPLQLRQLFQNLITNALKFHKPDEPPLIEVSSKLYELTEDSASTGAKAGERRCEITVRDHGIGFEQKFADQIFVVFQRLHSRTEYEGTGIGLAVCRKITDRHSGRIMAYSAAGEGATFVVTLPVKQPSTETNEPKRSDADNDSDGR